jgi:DNA-directed RNA polymerase subunit H
MLLRVSYEWRRSSLAPTSASKTKTVRRKKVEDEVPPFKVSTHFLIPKHELLTREEAESVVGSHNATPSQFPYILSIDPIAKEVGAKPGDFIKITRKSDTAGSSIYYRYVVEG